jgi:hypothetical protein
MNTSMPWLIVFLSRNKITAEAKRGCVVINALRSYK